MNKQIFVIIILGFFVKGLSASSDSLAICRLQQQVMRLQNELKSQKNDFSKSILQSTAKMDSLQQQVAVQNRIIATLADSLNIKITQNEQNTKQKIAIVETRYAMSLRGGIIGGIVLLLLAVTLFAWLYRKQRANRADIILQLEKQRKNVDEQLVQQFSQHTEILQSLSAHHSQYSISNSQLEIDHSLALKLADEITLMERNIALMDASTKGLKQLNRSISTLKDNLIANDYQMPELLGKPYTEGLNATIINSIENENLAKNTTIITKIIKPQVNYHNKMIQAAEIEVSVN
ncbi:MAG: hypothetical protein LBR36_03460 [Bacteroidales bacterium]|nr:hypothetical protein [Bacteroidales bacterium]